MNKIMNELQIISTAEVVSQQVNVYGTADKPLFLAKDVANWIEHSNPRMMIAQIDEDEKICVNNPYALKGQQEQWFLTEDGVYEVLMLSRKPIAKQFKKGVKEILVSIRKHGAYMTEQTLEKALTSPDFLIKLATQLKEEKTKRLEAEHQAELMKPKALFADAVATSERSCLIGELAKLICQNGVKIGGTRLFKWMRDNKYLCSFGSRYNQPTQRSMELGLFEIKETTVTKPNGQVLVTTTPKVTGKGQIYFINKFLSNGEKSDNTNIEGNACRG